MRAEAGAPALRIGIRCDAGPVVGVGHLVRCTALAEELQSRGHEAVFLGDLGGVAFAERQLTSRGLTLQPPPAGPDDAVAAVSELALDAVVLDSYVLDPAVSAALVAAGVPVLAVVDGDACGQSADLYLDQNIGAERDAFALAPGASRLAGTSYALLRDAVRSLRPPAPWTPSQGPLQVVVAFGGTDAFGMTTATVHALAATGAAFRATVITPDPLVRERAVAAAGPGQTVEAVAPFDGFPALLAGADLVLGAAGTSAWEYCCLGRAAAVVAVAGNQHTSYDRLVDAGAVLGLGLLDELAQDPALLPNRLAAVVADEAGRAEAARTAHALVDGEGRARVVSALEDLVAAR